MKVTTKAKHTIRGGITRENLIYTDKIDDKSGSTNTQCRSNSNSHDILLACNRH